MAGEETKISVPDIYLQPTDCGSPYCHGGCRPPISKPGAADPIAIWMTARAAEGISEPADDILREQALIPRYLAIREAEVGAEGVMFDRIDNGQLERRREGWRAHTIHHEEVGIFDSHLKGRTDVPGSEGIPTEVPFDSLREAPGEPVQLGDEGLDVLGEATVV